MREDDGLVLTDDTRVSSRLSHLVAQTIDNSLHRRDDGLLLSDTGVGDLPLIGSTVDQSGITAIESLIVEGACLRLLCRTVADDTLGIADTILELTDHKRSLSDGCLCLSEIGTEGE